MSLRPRTEAPAPLPAWLRSASVDMVVGGGRGSAGHVTITNDKTREQLKVPAQHVTAMNGKLFSKEELTSVGIFEDDGSTMMLDHATFTYTATSKYAPGYTFWVRGFHIHDETALADPTTTKFMVMATPRVRGRVTI